MDATQVLSAANKTNAQASKIDMTNSHAANEQTRDDSDSFSNVMKEHNDQKTTSPNQHNNTASQKTNSSNKDHIEAKQKANQSNHEPKDMSRKEDTTVENTHATVVNEPLEDKLSAEKNMELLTLQMPDLDTLNQDELQEVASLTTLAMVSELNTDKPSTSQALSHHNNQTQLSNSIKRSSHHTTSQLLADPLVQNSQQPLEQSEGLSAQELKTITQQSISPIDINTQLNTNKHNNLNTNPLLSQGTQLSPHFNQSELSQQQSGSYQQGQTPQNLADFVTSQATQLNSAQHLPNFAHTLQQMNTSDSPLLGGLNNNTAIFQHNTPLHQPNWNVGFVERINLMLKQDMPSAEIQLHPPELGSIQAKIKIDNGSAELTFTAQHHSVKEAIENNLARLKETFANSGLELGDVSVSQQQNQQDTQTDHDNNPNDGVDGRQHTEVEETITQTSVNSQHKGLIDYYT